MVKRLTRSSSVRLRVGKSRLAKCSLPVLLSYLTKFTHNLHSPMKTRNWLLGLLSVALLALTACGNKDFKPPEYHTINDVRVDIPQLEEAFANAPDAQRLILSNDVLQGARYGNYEQALAGLDALSTDTTLTDPQKQIVNKVLEQMKQVLAKAPPPTQ